MQVAFPHAVDTRALVVGEVIWDEFADSRRLGGAPLNFAAHLQRLRHYPRLVSAVGTDRAGHDARQAIIDLGLDISLLQSTTPFVTGHARIHIDAHGEVSFEIERPAAYDAVEISDEELQQIVGWNPAWFYYGTLFPSSSQARGVLRRLMSALPDAIRFYDVNLRPGFEAPELVDELLHAANVVKINERELRVLHEYTALPFDAEGFCRAGCERFGWRAVSVTLGARGCAMLIGGEYVEAPGLPVDVIDTVGAGDAFAAAFMHGLVSNWPAGQTARFANRVGALVASAPGAIPAWSSEDVNQ